MSENFKYRKVLSKEGYYSVAPMPSYQEIEEHYAQYYESPKTTTYQTSYTEEELDHKRLRARLLMHALGKQNIVKKDFLEVGCGEGFILREAYVAGYQVRGIDFTDFGVRSFHPELSEFVLKGNAFRILDEEIDSGITVSVCVLQNVLEHVPDEKLLLGKISKIIGNSGVAVITVPNDYSQIQLYLRKNNKINREYWFAPPEHLHYFNIESLARLIKSEGLEILDSYGDFPIEMYLFHPGSNYVLNASAGRAAHMARVTLDLLLSRHGLEAYLSYCRAMTACGIGRNVTVIVRNKVNGT